MQSIVGYVPPQALTQVSNVATYEFQGGTDRRLCAGRRWLARVASSAQNIPICARRL